MRALPDSQIAAAISEMQTKYGVPVTPQESAEITEAVLPLIDKGGVDAAIKFQTHLIPIADSLSIRNRYDPAIVPVPCHATAATAATMLGCDPTDARFMETISQYNAYVEEYMGAPESFNTKSMSVLWNDASIQKAYPRVAALGRWYAAYVATSVAAERAFGVMRAIDVPNRARMSEITFKEQLLSRYDRERTVHLVRHAIIKASPSTIGAPGSLTPVAYGLALPPLPHPDDV